MNVFKNTLVVAMVLTVAVGKANGLGKKGNAIDGMVSKVIDVKNDPTFVRKGDRLFMNLLNLDQEKVVIRVKDSDGRLVFSEVIKGELIIEKAFNFEKAFSDRYIVEIIDDSKSFKEVVYID